MPRRRLPAVTNNRTYSQRPADGSPPKARTIQMLYIRLRAEPQPIDDNDDEAAAAAL